MKKTEFDPKKFLAALEMDAPEQSTLERRFRVCRDCGCNCAEKRRQRGRRNIDLYASDDEA